MRVYILCTMLDSYTMDGMGFKAIDIIWTPDCIHA
jgi:hypothetical protein